jgi:hypothetical protein
MVGGTAALGGTLELTLINGFVPTSGQVFNVVTYGSHTATFSNVALTNFPAGLGANVTYSGGAGAVTITAQ